MRKFHLLILAAFSFLAAPCQTATVSFPNNMVVYQGTETPLQVSVAGYSCKKIFIKTDNGIIESVMDCRYNYRPERIGQTIIDVFIIKRKDTVLIGKQLFVVKDKPSPEANIGGIKGGNIKKRILKAQKGIGASFYITGNHWESCSVESYHIIVTRNDSIIYTWFNQGNVFNEEVVRFFDRLTNGDKIAFINIQGCVGRSPSNKLQSIEFKIEE